MPHALIGLGANLSEPAEQIRRSLELLARLPAAGAMAVSHHYRVAAVGGPTGQADFLNVVARLDWDASAEELLHSLERIERELGRTRSTPWAPRLVDLDLLALDEIVLDTVGLQLPHPWMTVRGFVLRPAAEVAPDFKHPRLQARLADLWEQLQWRDGWIGLTTSSGTWRPDCEQAARQAVDQVRGEYRTGDSSPVAAPGSLGPFFVWMRTPKTAGEDRAELPSGAAFPPIVAGEPRPGPTRDVATIASLPRAVLVVDDAPIPSGRRESSAMSGIWEKLRVACPVPTLALSLDHPIPLEARIAAGLLAADTLGKNP